MPEIRVKRYNFEHTRMEMFLTHNRFIREDGVLANPPPYLAPLSPSHSSGNKISPAVLFVIVILAVLFFISGVLHLLVRFLSKHPSSSSQSNDRYPEMLPSDALERQLQQLFHLHDSGLDQAFIDALPVFMYKEIGNVANEPFDCAVCLCEFTEKDQLRLLPVCSHAFHINCIDTWLLTNSTCPLCRGALFTPGISIENPTFDFDDFRDDEGFPQNVEIGYVPRQKTMEIEENAKGKGVLKVRLGKFRKMGNGDDVADVGETSNSNLDARRCYSMGSYQYVVGHKNLKVAFSVDQSSRHMRFERELKTNIDPTITDGDMEGKKLSIGSKTDSYSVSKIWLWSKKSKFASSSDSQ